ncbi:MAG: 16S rRNA (cytosine(967)-C(5))-methyltransferase RsmB [Candidatus Sulfotelmatobacter sp.]
MKKRKREPQAAVSPARAAAFDILLRIERESSYATELLHSKTFASLSKADHSLATELVMGVLRWRSLLDLEISRSSSLALSKLDLEILTALRLAVYQLRGLSRIPARAAIYESVEVVKRARKRSAAPFVNAVLRKIDGAALRSSEFDPLQIDVSSVETLATGSAHPLWLVERWARAYGFEAAAQICRQDQSVPVTTIRLRHRDAEERLRGEGIELAPGALLASARKVLRGDITASAAFRSGGCGIQDEASQLVAALVGHGASVLDCCAAPGGKTLAIADRNAQAHITAVDLHTHRARLLQRLLRADDSSGKTGEDRIGVVAADARNLPFAANFDRVLADVPCSGTGTLSRNPEIKWRLMPKDLADLQVRQLAILKSAMAQVSRGGRLVYSTCSLEREENEDVIERALADDSSFRVVDCGDELAKLKQRGELIWDEISVLTRGSYLRTLPGVHPCDGFFAAILEKS